MQLYLVKNKSKQYFFTEFFNTELASRVFVCHTGLGKFVRMDDYYTISVAAYLLGKSGLTKLRRV
jgi:hypothetical protein